MFFEIPDLIWLYGWRVVFWGAVIWFVWQLFTDRILDPFSNWLDQRKIRKWSG